MKEDLLNKGWKRRLITDFNKEYDTHRLEIIMKFPYESKEIVEYYKDHYYIMIKDILTKKKEYIVLISYFTNILYFGPVKNIKDLEKTLIRVSNSTKKHYL